MAARLREQSDDVFEVGRFETKSEIVKTSDAAKPPTELFLVSPVSEGSYPVLAFFHGFLIPNSWYSNLLQHIASHGYVVVAPKIYGIPSFIYTNNKKEVKIASEVVGWILSSLSLILPQKVKPNLENLAVSGHSRGGKTAFCLAQQNGAISNSIKAVIGVDPSSGIGIPCRTDPKILKYIPRSFDISIPVALVGAGLSNEPVCLIPPFAPNGCNHAEYFNESKPPCSYFLATEYGHCDMLDDLAAGLAGLICKSGKGAKDLMRRGVAGVVVAFLQAYLEGDDSHLIAIVDGTTPPPITLDPIIYLQ